MPTRASNTYGTIQSDSDGETAGLLGKRPSPSLTSRLHRHMNANVSEHWADLILLACYLITGLLDSCSVLIWGSFVSMQTGNTVYLGQGLIRPSEDNRWPRSLVSIAAFILGSFVFSRWHRAFASPRRRWIIVVASFVQLMLVVVAALMVTLGPPMPAPGTGSQSAFTVWIAVPIALVAFQSAGQAVLSRVVEFKSLTSVVLTSIYCDFASDPKIFAGLTANAERNQRVAAPILLCLGAAVGGVWAHSEIGMMGALWMAVGLKTAVIIAWLFWAAEEDEGGD